VTMWRLAYNPRDVPIVIDSAGHTLGGRDWAAVDADTPEVQAALKRRQVVFPAQPPGPDGNPRAFAAQQRVDELNGTSNDGDDSEGGDS
jgi:hypothetical protein